MLDSHEIDSLARWARGMGARYGLQRVEDLPAELWSDMLDMLRPGDDATLMQTLITLTAAGGWPGIALALLVQRLLVSFVGETQESLCLAVSEAGVGAHPKFLQTSARLAGETWLISGSKSYLTNVSAGRFIVLAVTGMQGQRKRYSAFMVKAGSPGLTMGEPMDLDMLKPVRHGSIIMEECPAEALIGEPGTAYEEIAIPFRQREEIFMLGILTGIAKYLGAETGRLEELVMSCDLREPDSLPPEFAAIFGQMLAEKRASWQRHPDGPRLLRDIDGLLALGQRALSRRRKALLSTPA